MQEDRKVDALLRFHFKVDPEQLDDEARVKLWYEFLYARQNDRDFYLGILRQSIAEAFSSK